MIQFTQIAFQLANKKFFRSPQWEQNLVIRIFIIIIIFICLASFFTFGLGLFWILKKDFPDQDPVLVINQWLVYYFSVELLMRYFLQNLPVADIQHLLLHPISKKKIVLWMLLRSVFSISNLPLLILGLPFVIAFSKSGEASGHLWVWFLGLLGISLSFNFAIFLINKSKGFAIGVFTFLVLIAGLEKQNLFPVKLFFTSAFDHLYSAGLIVFIPLGIVLVTFFATYRFLLGRIYLDQGLKTKEGFMLGQLTVFDRFGVLGFFLKNDLRLIVRNIRARQVVLMGFFFLFYGLFFFTQDVYKEMQIMHVFVGIFITGGFMITFGQYVPAWDSEYYRFLMCQNISYQKYLESKWLLMVFTVVVASVLSFPYLYFGLAIYKVILAAGCYNIGIGSLVSIYSGAYNRKPIKLNVKAKAFENTQAFNMTQLLFMLPKLFLPMLLFYLPYKFVSFNAGIIFLVVSGLLGFFFRIPILKKIEKVYQKNKYKTLASFQTQNA